MQNLNNINIMGEKENDSLVDDNFLFISYSHKNADIIAPILKALEEKGVNFWFDKDLEVGKRWNDSVKIKISDQRCAGSILFVSEEWASSDACAEEYDYIKNHHIGYIYPILIGDLNSPVIKRGLLDFFNIDDKVLLSSGDDESINQLVRTLEKADIKVINNFAAITGKLLDRKLAYRDGNSICFNFGDYPQNKRNDEIDRYYTEKVFTDDFEERKFMFAKGKDIVFEFEPIKWRIISCDKDEIRLISRYNLLDSTGSIADLSAKIEEFKLNAFENVDKEFSLDVIDFDFISKNLKVLKKEPLEDSSFVKNCNNHQNSVFFIKKNEKIEIVDNEFNVINSIGVSLNDFHGSPILVLTIKTIF